MFVTIPSLPSLASACSRGILATALYNAGLIVWVPSLERLPVRSVRIVGRAAVAPLVPLFGLLVGCISLWQCSGVDAPVLLGGALLWLWLH